MSYCNINIDKLRKFQANEIIDEYQIEHWQISEGSNFIGGALMNRYSETKINESSYKPTTLYEAFYGKKENDDL